MKATLLVLVGYFLTIPVFAQENPFKGSGKVKTFKYDFTDFNKISFYDVDGPVEIEVGKPFAIEVQINENFISIFDVKQENNQLNLTFRYTKDNNKYIQNMKLKVKISCPSLLELFHRGNSSISVTGINGADFAMINEGNGSATLAGTVKQLSLSKDGNGSITASNLFAETAKVKTDGNGSVFVNSSLQLSVERMGNGNVIQKGNGRIL